MLVKKVLVYFLSEYFKIMFKKIKKVNYTHTINDIQPKFKQEYCM